MFNAIIYLRMQKYTNILKNKIFWEKKKGFRLRGGLESKFYNSKLWI